MKLAITGKGGVGKTTVSGTLARILADKGVTVYAIDADPDANLASAVGIAAEDAASIIPISSMNELIKERTGAEPGTSAPVFKLNPRVDDLPAGLSVEQHGVRLLKLGTVKKGGSGCICPESSLLRSLVTHLVLYEKEAVILDMEAGIEHLGRATAKGVDAMLVVVEPGRRSLQTAEAVQRMAADIGVDNVFLVVNKVTTSDDEFCRHIEDYFSEGGGGLPLLGCLPFDEQVRKADLDGVAAFDAAPAYVTEVAVVLDKLEKLIAARAG
ncbi:MAG: ATP-binding protein [Thermoleophilia bacterium]